METANEALLKVKKQLELNNFEVFIAADAADAREVFENKILSNLEISSASFADSMTMLSTGALEVLKHKAPVEFIDPFDASEGMEGKIRQRKRALTVDLFLTGTNAITEKGQLVNLDMIGNRVGAITFGPTYVVLFVGKNKLVKDLDAAFHRIRTVGAPLNVKRHEKFKTPCQITGICDDCRSPHRICNTWTITEKSYPPKRIKIILIDQEMGL